MAAKPLIHLQNIAVRVRSRRLLQDTSWEIRDGQQWAVIGPNGAGKSSLVGVLTGDVPCVQGRVIRRGGGDGGPPGDVAAVSLELQDRLLCREELRDDARAFSGKDGQGPTVRETIADGLRGPAPGRMAEIAEILGLTELLERDVRFLSTGEMRKVLIAGVLLRSPGLLVLDEPFAGLDEAARREAAKGIDRLMSSGAQIVLVANRLEEISPGITHVLCVKDGRVVRQGPRSEVLTTGLLEELYGREEADAAPEGRQETADSGGEVPETLVEIVDASVRFGEVVVFDGFSWAMKRGEHWAVVGPNGSGKSTLLHLITGDNLQGYANDVYVFGRRKGSGESLWEIREKIGFVSPKLQSLYRKGFSVRDVVASGLFDSVGLYRLLSPEGRDLVGQAVARLGIGQLADAPFDHLSYGERRMVLIARAMVKSPLLLILDEPCSGLDRTNRRRVLERIEAIGCGGRTQLLFVTHHPEDLPRCINRILRLG